MIIDTFITDTTKLILGKRKLLSSFLHFHGKELKILIIGGFNTEELIDWIKIFCMNYDLKINIKSFGWGNFYQLLNSDLNIKKNEYDCIIVLPFFENLLTFPFDNNNLSVKYLSILENFYEKCLDNNITVIQGDFIASIIWKNNPKTHSKYLKSLNILNNNLYDLSYKYPNVTLCFTSHLSNQIGLNNWYDRRNWVSFGNQLGIDASINFGKYISSILSSIYIGPKKVLILDLDNTLWEGVIGDDGPDGIIVGPDTPEGRPYYEFQQYIKNLKSDGVLLAICSKNNFNVAIKGFDNKGMLLQLSDFSAIKIGWEPKSKYISEIADELNLGLNSFVFVDDNPVEREEVRSSLKNVSVPEIGNNIIRFIDCLEDYRYFYSNNEITNEDIFRHESYKHNKARDELLSFCSNENEFLKSLNTKIFISKANESSINRIIQLFNKTNQFNTSNLRIAPGEIDSILAQENVFSVKASDKFGDYGIISTFRLIKSDNNIYIKNWVMSCRIFNRRVEEAIFEWIIKYSKFNNNKYIYIDYIKTEKNLIIENLFKNLGFLKVESDNNSKNLFRIEISGYNKTFMHYCMVTSDDK